MSRSREPLPAFLSEPSRIGDEISITGKWVPATPGRIFRRSPDSTDMLQEWEDIHTSARSSPGVLSTEINHAVGEDAVLVHHVFADAEALTNYFETTGTQHMAALTAVATPDLHMVRGLRIPEEVRAAVDAKGVPAAYGEFLFGYAKHDYAKPDAAAAINVTAKWEAKPDIPDALADLEYWWQRVPTDAYDMEAGLIRYEAYRVIDDDALIIHEVFDTNADLKFHLTKGTAEKYKKDIDEIAEPNRYFFRGPVSWTIRTYSKFMHLPATYSSQGSNFTAPTGSASDGFVA